MAAILKMAAILNFFNWPHILSFLAGEGYHWWKFHACCQNGTIFSPNCCTRYNGAE